MTMSNDNISSANNSNNNNKWALCQDLKVVPFEVMTGRYEMIGNSGGVTNLSESLEVLSLSIM